MYVDSTTGIYLLKVKNEKSRATSENISKAIIKTAQRRD